MADKHSTGVHVLLDLHKCNSKLLNDDKYLLEVIKEAAKIANMTVLNSCSHKFEPQGVSCILLLAESHISIHTWPERQFASVDIYSCNPNSPVSLAADYIESSVNSMKAKQKTIYRG